MAGGAGLRSGAESAARWAHNPPRRAHARPPRPRFAAPKPRGTCRRCAAPHDPVGSAGPATAEQPQSPAAATLRGPAHRGSAETPAGRSVGRTELLLFSFWAGQPPRVLIRRGLGVVGTSPAAVRAVQRPCALWGAPCFPACLIPPARPQRPAGSGVPRVCALFLGLPTSSPPQHAGVTPSSGTHCQSRRPTPSGRREV